MPCWHLGVWRQSVLIYYKSSSQYNIKLLFCQADFLLKLQTDYFTIILQEFVWICEINTAVVGMHCGNDAGTCSMAELHWKY